jgi:hypothetical protein
LRNDLARLFELRCCGGFLFVAIGYQTAFIFLSGELRLGTLIWKIFGEVDVGFVGKELRLSNDFVI